MKGVNKITTFTRHNHNSENQKKILLLQASCKNCHLLFRHKNCYLLFRNVNPKTLLKFFLVITGHVFAFIKVLPRTDLGMALYVKTHSNMNLDRSGFPIHESWLYDSRLERQASAPTRVSPNSSSVLTSPTPAQFPRSCSPQQVILSEKDFSC